MLFNLGVHVCKTASILLDNISEFFDSYKNMRGTKLYLCKEFINSF